MRRLSPRKDFSVKQLLQRVDRIAGDLNVLLIVIAIILIILAVAMPKRQWHRLELHETVAATG